MKTEDFETADRTDVGPRTVAVAVAMFALIAVLVGTDILADYRAGTRPQHVLAEAIVMAIALAGAVVLWLQSRQAQLRAQRLAVDLESARQEAKHFRAEARDALRGLGEAIDRQFTRWELSPAEREVGLLLLKGLSHKQIAALRSTSETTIRQQALALYRKSGLRSRAELSAFFLEDILLPADQR
jgi:DNA-binding NarL/FixJ family response regulator